MMGIRGADMERLLENIMPVIGWRIFAPAFCQRGDIKDYEMGEEKMMVILVIYWLYIGYIWV